MTMSRRSKGQMYPSSMKNIARVLKAGTFASFLNSQFSRCLSGNKTHSSAVNCEIGLVLKPNVIANAQVKNLTQAEYNWHSKFPCKDFNLFKILSVTFIKSLPLVLFLFWRSCSLYANSSIYVPTNITKCY